MNVAVSIDARTALLFSPCRLAGLDLRSRIVMAPMTRCMAEDGVPGPATASYYARRAAADVGLIMSEGIGVDHPAALGEGTFGERNMPVLQGAAAIAGWRAVTDAVHAAGGLIFAQLWHQGPLRRPGSGPQPRAVSCRPDGRWGPLDGSTSAPPDYLEAVRPPTVAMTDNDIADVIAAFGRSAAHAQTAGFDGIALHGAHGYLIDSFLWPETNSRVDAWGRTLAARTRFAVAVIEAVRAAAPALPVAFRYSQWKLQDYDARLVDTPDMLAALLAPLVDAGVDLFDVSTRVFHRPAFAGSPLSLAGWTRRLTGVPAIAVGGVGLSRELKDSLMAVVPAEDNVARAVAAIERGEFDLLGVGRALLADPDWARKLRQGAPLPAFSPAAFATLI